MIRTLWATAALLAIFAMHGLAAHAGSHDPAPIQTVGTTHAGHASMAADDTSPAAASALSHGEPGHEMAALGLWAAVLATSAIMLLVRLGRPRSGLLALWPRAVAIASHPVGVRAGSHPPDLHALSVLRC